MVDNYAYYAYLLATFRPRTPPFFEWQSQNLWSVIKSLAVYQISHDYIWKFLDYKAFCFGKVQFFSPPPQRFSINNFMYKNATLFIF